MRKDAHLLFVAFAALLSSCRACPSDTIVLSTSSSVVFNSSVGYEPNCTTMWHISVPPGSVQRISITHTLETTSDRILLYNGFGLDESGRFGVIFGRTATTNVVLFSTTNDVAVVFITDALTKMGAGFIANITAAPPVIHCSGMNTSLAIGVSVSEPLTPGASYALNARCGWFIACNDSGFISLSVTNVSTLPWDTLKIFNGFDETAVLLATASGITLPPTVRAAAPGIYVIFQSGNASAGDPSARGRGFRFTTSFSPGPLRCPALTTGTLSNTTANLIFSAAPGVGYLPGQVCAWRFSIPYGSFFQPYDFPYSTYSIDIGLNDALEFFDGPDDRSPLIQRLSGRTCLSAFPAPPVPVSGLELFIRFSASSNDRVTTRTGFAFPMYRGNRFVMDNSVQTVLMGTAGNIEFVQIPDQSQYRYLSYMGLGNATVIADARGEPGLATKLDIWSCYIADGDSVVITEGDSPSNMTLAAVVVMGPADCEFHYTTLRAVLSVTLISTHNLSQGTYGIDLCFTAYTPQPQCSGAVQIIAPSARAGAPRHPPGAGSPYRITPYAVNRVCTWNFTCNITDCLAVAEIFAYDFGPGVALLFYSGNQYMGNLTGCGQNFNVLAPTNNLRFVFNTSGIDSIPQYTGFEATFHYKIATQSTEYLNSYSDHTFGVFGGERFCKKEQHITVFSSASTYSYTSDQAEFGPAQFSSNVDWQYVPPNYDAYCRWEYHQQHGILSYLVVPQDRYNNYYPPAMGNYWVYDGDTTDAPIISGSGFTGLGVGVSGKMLVIYNNTALGSGHGFVLTMTPYGWDSRPVYDPITFNRVVRSGAINITLSPTEEQELVWVDSTPYLTYAVGQTIQYTVRGVPGSHLRVVCSRSNQATTATIKVYDGDTANAPLILNGCSSYPPTMVSTGSVLYIVYASPAEDHRLFPVQQVRVASTVTGVACQKSMELVARSTRSMTYRTVFSLSSPYFIFPTLQCAFVIRAAVGSVIRLDVTVDIADTSTFSIRDGRDLAAPLLGLTTGTYYSTGAVAFIYFDAGSSYALASRTGVSFTTQAVDITPPSYPQGEQTVFVYRYTATPTVAYPISGDFVAGRYPLNSNYSLHFIAESFSFLTFTLSFTTEPNADYIEILERGQLIWSGSGDGSSLVVTTLCNQATLRFTSNGVTTARDQGFRVSIAAKLSSSPLAVCRPTLSTQICPGRLLASNNSIAQYAACIYITGPIIFNNTLVPSLPWPNLEIMNGTFSLSSSVASLHLPALRLLGGLSFVPDLVLPSIREVGMLFWCPNTGDSDPNLILPSLQSVDSIELIGSGGELTEIDLSGLISAGTITLSKLDELTSLTLPSHAWGVSNKFSVDAAAQLLVADFSHATMMTCLRICNTGIYVVDLSGIVGTMYLLTISSSATSDIIAPNVTRISGGAITLASLSSLKRFDFSSLSDVTNGISLISTGLSAVSLPSLFQTSLTLQSNPSLTSINLPRLFYVFLFILTDSVVGALPLPALGGALGAIKLQDNPYLTTLDACRVTNLGGLIATGNRLLSCSDLQGTLVPLAPPDQVTITDCSITATGNFGCSYNVSLTVGLGCNSTRCIQDLVAAAVSGHGTTVYVPAGTYTGCADTPVSPLGKALRIFGAGMGQTVIDCENVGQGLVINAEEGSDTIVEDITFMNGHAATGGIALLANSAAPILRRLAFTSGRASVAGGAVAVTSGAFPRLEDCVISDSSAPTGGGLYVSNASIMTAGGEIRGCSATESGGGIAVMSPSSPPTITGVRVAFNSAARGGGLFADSALACEGVTVANNTASLFGGGAALIPIVTLGVAFNFTSSIVADNSAGQNGGGIYAFSADLNLFTSTVAGNGAQTGGGIYAICSQNLRLLSSLKGACDVRVVLDGSMLLSNVASLNGGGIAAQFVALSVLNSNLTGNAAVTGGGAYAATTTLVVRESSVAANSAAQSGGGISCEPFTGVCDIASTAFTGNEASSSGGAVFLCVGACAATNASTGAVLPYANSMARMPDLRGLGNSYTSNTVRAGGYGMDVATDPAVLVWLAGPLDEVVSGRGVTSGSPLLLSVRDAFGSPVTSAATALVASLSVDQLNGASASSQATVSGATTVLVNGGQASFSGVSMVAKSLGSLDADYLLTAELSDFDGVSLSVRIHLLPCQPGQGTSGNGTVSCADCIAGTFGSGTGAYTCEACPAGSFAADLRSVACTPCAAQSYAPTPGASACIACPSGYHSEAGAVACSQIPVAAADDITSVAVPVGATVGVLLVLAVVAAILAWRYARRRTLKKYYLDADSTIRTGAVKSPLQRAVEEMVVNSSTTRIGGGVYADVYKARYKGRWIALKVLKAESIGNGLALDEFQRETVAMSRLNEKMHPGIVRLQFFLQRKPMCIGMEFCPNGSVKAAIGRGLDITEGVRILTEAASALTVLHELNIAHLDIKTDNLLLDADNHVKMADFGISQTVRGDEDSTVPLEYVEESNPLAFMSYQTTGTMVTMETMLGSETINPAFNRLDDLASIAPPPPPPELATVGTGSHGSQSPPGSMASRPTSMRRVSMFVERAAAAYTPQYVDPMRIDHDVTDIVFLKEADIFSFALVMWAVLNGEEPYAGEHVNLLLASLKENLQKRPPPVRALPTPLEQLMRTCWDHEREKRPTTRALFAALNGILKESYATDLLNGYLLTS